MQTNDDNLRPWFYSGLVHLGILALVTGSFLWAQDKAPTLAGPIIEASLVGPAQAPKPKTTKPKPKPVEAKPEPEKPKPAEPAQEPLREDRKDQEKITDKLTAEKAAEDARVQEALRKKAQVELQEKERLEAAEKKKKLEEEKQKQLKDKQAKALAAEQAKLEKEYQDSLVEGEEAKTGQEGQDNSLEAEYFAAIQNAVTNAWLRPENTAPGLRCVLHIVQIPGGDLLRVELGTPCNADPLTRQSLEQAVNRAAPLPYKGYEQQFRREINLNFRYDG